MNVHGISKGRRWLVAAALLVLGVAGARAQDAPFSNNWTLQKLTEQADSIVVAKCSKRESRFVNGNIITHYTLSPSETWKGKPKLTSAGQMELDQLGGSLETPLPIAQFDPASVHMKEGQEVILFTQAPAAQSTGGPSLASASGKKQQILPKDQPRIVGGNNGIFTIVRDPQNGKQLVVQGSEAGMAPPEMVNKAIERTKAAARQQIKASAQAKAQSAASAGPALQSASQPLGKPAVDPFEDLSKMHDAINAILAKKAEAAK